MLECPDCGGELIEITVYTDRVLKCTKCRAEFDANIIERDNEDYDYYSDEEY